MSLVGIIVALLTGGLLFVVIVYLSVRFGSAAAYRSKINYLKSIAGIDVKSKESK